MRASGPGRFRCSVSVPAKFLTVALLSTASIALLTVNTTTASANSLVLKYAASATTAPSSRDRALTTSGLWDQAIGLTSSAGLNAGGNAGINAISCSSAGNCSAGGSYLDASGKSQAFVMTNTNLTGPIIEVPGTATLNAGGNAYVNSISCSSAGNCGAGGTYTDGSGNTQGFVVNEVNSTWSNATEVVDPSAKAGVGSFGINSISCAGSGSCSAVGEDLASSGSSVGYAVTETNGVWSNAIELSITTSFGVGGTGLAAVSCTSPGNCSADGNGLFPDKAATSGTAFVPYVVDEINGTWGTPIEFPGLGVLNAGMNASINDISCSSPGNCSAGGNYADGAGIAQAFVDSEYRGTWEIALQVPSISRLTVSNSTIDSISCTSFGNCGAIGSYANGTKTYDFVVEEYEGTWLGAQQLPGSLFVNGTAGAPGVISCSFVDTCSAGGLYVDGAGDFQAFVVYQLDGAWGDPIEVPGTPALNAGGEAAVTSISCSADSSCGAGGYYTDASSNFQAFISYMSPFYAAQATLHVTSTHGTLGTALRLTSSGGSGTGTEYFSVVNGSAKGCVISPTNTLSASTSGTCLVTVSRTNDGTYLAAASTATPVSFALPVRPHPLTVEFAANSSSLSTAMKSALTQLSKKLIGGASITVTGSAFGNMPLAMLRDQAVAHFLSGSVAIHVTEKAITNSTSNAVTIITNNE